MIVYRMTIGLDKEGHKFYSDIQTLDMRQDICDKFNWDKIIRMDIMHVDKNQNVIALLSNNEEIMKACQYGMYAIIDATLNWNRIFSKEKHEKLSSELSQSVKDNTATKIGENGYVHFSPLLQ